MLKKNHMDVNFFNIIFNYDLPKFQITNHNGKEYEFEINDDLNSKSKKSFVILNYAGIKDMKI